MMNDPVNDMLTVIVSLDAWMKRAAKEYQVLTVKRRRAIMKALDMGVSATEIADALGITHQAIANLRRRETIRQSGIETARR